MTKVILPSLSTVENTVEKQHFLARELVRPNTQDAITNTIASIKITVKIDL